MQYLSSYVYRPIEKGIRRYYVIPEPNAPNLLGRQDSISYTGFFRIQIPSSTENALN